MKKSLIPAKGISIFWLVIFLFYFSCLLQAVIFFSGKSGFNGLRDAIMFSLLWLIPILLFPAKTRIITAVLGIILWLASLVAVGYFIIYGTEFSQSVLFVMFESNLDETGEYLSQYFSVTTLLLLLIYSLGALFLWSRVRPIQVSRRSGILISLLLLSTIVGIPVYQKMVIKQATGMATVNYLAGRMGTTTPWQFLSSYIEYRHQLSAMNNLLKQNEAIPPLTALHDVNGETPRTVVLVIGESTSSMRMSLYGYPRPTTPNLDKRASSDPNFVVFNDVVTSRPYTIEILQQALTFADQLQPDLYLTKPSLMNMMKQAGYKSFWITTQQTMTKRNTMLTVFSQQTDEQVYLNNNREQNAKQYDEIALKPFDEALSDPAPKKFIVVHLLGTHMNYKYRYPENFEFFTGREGVAGPLSDSELEKYNQYDNAERYNDYVVEQLIQTYAKHDPNGFLLYFSDHGEEVYQTPPYQFIGRNEREPTAPMYRIPFLLWISPQWQQSHPQDYRNYVDRKYSLSHLIHTWSDLVGLSYDGFEAQKSLVNPAFQPMERLIGDPYTKNALRNFDDLPQ